MNADQIQMLSIAKATDDDMADKMQALALERGDLKVKADDGSGDDLFERSIDTIPTAPTTKGIRGGGDVEGYQPRKVRFLEQ